MRTRTGCDRAAAAVLAVTGLILLVFTVVGLAPAVLNLGSADEHLAGDATLTLMIAGPLLGFAVLITLGCAWLLWRGSPGARALAVLWILGAGALAAQALAGFGNVLWAVRVAILEPDLLLVRWPHLYWDPFLGSDVTGTPVENLPYGRLDDISFWLPGVIAGAVIAVTVLLVAGQVARHRGPEAGR